MTQTLLAVLLALSISSAHAAPPNCAIVLRTPDGFLALREGPGVKHKMIRKLHHAEILAITAGAEDDKWLQVDYASTDYGSTDKVSSNSTILSGWVFAKYLLTFTCPENAWIIKLQNGQADWPNWLFNKDAPTRRRQ
jgi:hypothetical protein